MDFAIILGVIIIGLIFLIVEVFAIPGTTITGIIGGIMIVVGNILAFTEYGTERGLLTLAVSGVLTVILVYIGYKTITSKRVALQDALEGRVNDDIWPVEIGEVGKAHTTIRPNGKGIFAAGKFEVYSIGDYIDAETPIKIVRIEKNKIYVKPQ